jgi:hypothetical protein
MERSEMDRHFSLLRTFVNCAKSFNIGSRPEVVASIPGTILMKAKVIIDERKESESEKIKEEPEPKPGGKKFKTFF